MRINDLLKDENMTDEDMFPVHTAMSSEMTSQLDSPKVKAAATVPLGLLPSATIESTVGILTSDTTSSGTREAKLPQTPGDAHPEAVAADQTDSSIVLSPERQGKDTKDISLDSIGFIPEIVSVSNILRLAVKQYSKQIGTESDLRKKYDKKSINSLGELIQTLKAEDIQDQKEFVEEETRFSLVDSSPLLIPIPGKLKLGVLIAYVVGGVGGWNVHDGVNTSLKEILSEMFISHVCISAQKAFTAKNTLERFKLAFKEAVLEKLELYSYRRSKYPLVSSYVNALVQDLYRSAAKVTNKQGDDALVVLKLVANRINGFLQFTVDGNKLSAIIGSETMDDQTIMQKIAEQNDKMKDALVKKGLGKTYYKQIGEVEKLLDLTLDKDKANKKYWIALYSMTKDSYGVTQSKTSRNLSALLEKVPKIGHSIFAEKREIPKPASTLPAPEAEMNL